MSLNLLNNNRKITRGVRNCNPCNLRRSSDKFQGEVAICRDRDFKQFNSMKYGVRAALCVLRTYIVLRHCCNIESIISRWAPPGDGNNTGAYISFVCSQTGLQPVAPISWKEESKVDAILKAMCLIESDYDLPDIVLQSARRLL